MVVICAYTGICRSACLGGAVHLHSNCIVKLFTNYNLELVTQYYIFNAIHSASHTCLLPLMISPGATQSNYKSGHKIVFLHFVISTLRISSQAIKLSTTVLTTSYFDEELFPKNTITLTIFLELNNVVICYTLPYYEHGSALAKTSGTQRL